jgi:hypothetical protein
MRPTGPVFYRWHRVVRAALGVVLIWCPVNPWWTVGEWAELPCAFGTRLAARCTLDRLGFTCSHP